MSRRVCARRRVCALSGRAVACERLEGRFLLSGVTWTGAGDGVNWTDARNWSSSPALPGPADDVTIPASTGTIHLASGDESIHSLTSSEAFSIDGGSLSVAGTAAWAARVTLSGGSLNGGTWSFQGAASMLATSADTTLNGLTINGSLDLGAQVDAQVSVLNGLDVAGTVLIGNTSGTTYGRLTFGNVSSPAGALTGHAVVLFGGSTNNAIINESNQSGDAGMLTLAADKIHGASGTILAAFPNGSLRNLGTIAPDVLGDISITGSFTNGGSLMIGPGSLTINDLSGPAGSVQFVNVPTVGGRGSALALNGNYTLDALTVAPNASLGLDGTWSCPSTITVTGGTLNLRGLFSLRPGEIVQTASDNTPHVNIMGTLDGDLTLDSSTGSWALSGGTIVGGTVTESDGQQLLLLNGTLNGVTLNAPLTSMVTGPLTVLNGLVLNGTIEPISQGTLIFGGVGLPAGGLAGNATIAMSGPHPTSIQNRSTLPGAGGMLTIGHSVFIHGYGSIGPNVMSFGSITSDVPGSALNMGGSLINSGILTATNRSVLQLSTGLVNNGTLSADHGGTLSISGAPAAVVLSGTISLTSNAILALSGVVNDYAMISLAGGCAVIGNAYLGIVAGRFALADSQTPTVNTVADLNLFNTAVLDLGNNILRMSSHLQDPTIRLYLHSAYDDGRWDGPGITSSDASAMRGIALLDTLVNPIAGVPPATIQIGLARVGDLNLDGKVSFADLLTLAQHYGQVNANWDQGDLNYDGTVGFDDLLMLARNFGQGTPGPDVSILRRRGYATLAARSILR